MSFFEQIKPFLRDPSDVDKIKPFFAEAVEAELTTSPRVHEIAASLVPGLAKAKQEILDEKKALQRDYEALKQKAGYFDSVGITPDKLAEMQNELNQLRAVSGVKGDAKESYEKGKADALSQHKLTLEAKQREHEQALSALEALRNKYISGRAKADVLAALDKAGIEPDEFFLDGLMTKAKIDWAEEDDKVFVSVPLDGQPVPVEQWAAKFATSDQGRARLRRRENQGAGAQGGRGGAAISLDDVAKISDPMEAVRAFRENFK